MSNTESALERGEQDTLSLRGFAPRDGHAAVIETLAGQTIGRYQVRGLLGAGGMGRVFTAVDPRLGRTVALKLIRSETVAASARARSRLLREAQALARLQHPNVVTIYDVGTDREQIFIAMELIAGETLGEWLARGPRSWRAIRDVFLAAGRGLVAAHAAGIVHRDFKPSNVIVGADRVVVVDFGLARAGDDDSGVDDGERGPDSGILDVDLTLTGERVGTPRYMAPEQHAGGPVTAQADQFSFAAALWSAFYGAPPFAGENSSEVLREMGRGAVTRATDRQVPERIRAALRRALAFRPADRWPALDDLLAELAHDPAAIRRRAIATVGLAVAIVAAPAAFLAGRNVTAPSCAAPPPSIWDETARAQVHAAFLATGMPFAESSFDRVDTSLRGRVADWSRAREEACAATEIRHEQSAAAMDARMTCLALEREKLEAFVGVLRAADVRAVERAGSAARAIGDLDACADGKVLASVVPPPRDAGRAGQLDGLEREVADLEALLLVGRMKEAAAASPALLEKARAFGHAPLLARALFTVGTRCETGDPRGAVATLYEALHAAGEARDDRLVARIYTSLVYCAGVRDVDAQAARALTEAAEAALARIGSPLDLRARLFRVESRQRRRAGDPINAFGLAQLALMTNRRLYAEDNAETAISLSDLGDLLQELGAYRGALEAYARALPILERAGGPLHPQLANYLGNMAAAAVESGDVDRASESLVRAIALNRQIYGPDQESAHHLLWNLAEVRRRQGQLAAARELILRVRAIDERDHGPGHPQLALDLVALAEIVVDGGAVDEAQALLDRADAIFAAARLSDDGLLADVNVVRAKLARRRHDLARARRLVEKTLAVHRRIYGARHPMVATDQATLAEVLVAAGQPRAALPLLEEALAIQEAARDGMSAEVATARTLLAEALLATGERGRAVPLAESAVAAAASRHLRADLDGRARFVLARALDASDRRRSEALARQARARFQGLAATDEVARIDRWLARRSLPGKRGV